MRCSVFLVLLLCFSARAEDAIPLLKGSSAPFSGVLLPEEKVTELLRDRLELENVSGQLRIQKNMNDQLEKMYLKRLEDASKPVAWYQTNDFHRWLGFFLGAAVTGLAVWGGSELVKAVK